MRAWLRLLALTAVFAVASAPALAAADLLYDFDWMRVDDFRTLLRVDRLNPDGSVTPFDEVRTTTEVAGSGVLRLAPNPTIVDPTHTWYDASLDGLVLASIGLGASPVVFPTCLNGLRGCLGQISTEGAADAPRSLQLDLLDVASPHCMFDCFSRTFSGVGVLSLAAPEPAIPWLTALGLASALLAARRPR